MSEAASSMNPAPRVRTFLKGVVYYDNRRVSIECTVRDLSETGARIAFTSAVTVPDNIELHITAKERTYKALVRRRDQYEIGVEFEDQRSGDARRTVDADVAQRMTALEQEVIALRKIVRKLRDKVLPNDTDVA
jgi:uncharacterized protein YceH (UPF0502 family)